MVDGTVFCLRDDHVPAVPERTTPGHRDKLFVCPLSVPFPGTYLEIGDYIFENIFGGDIEKLKSFNPHKESSFKRLSEREDLLMSKANLHRAVQVTIQEKRLLPTVSAMKRLTFTHKALLLPLKSNKKKEELANKCYHRFKMDPLYHFIGPTSELQDFMIKSIFSSFFGPTLSYHLGL